MTDLHTLWNTLPAADRTLFVEHADSPDLPAHVAQRAQAVRMPIVIGVTQDKSGASVTWPGVVREFLQRQAAEREA
ncbi:hypothetical protein [Micromonospora carbonacea]|uniref:Uncharacterized protein n=1 Tax=Micromonospora carbonacea TaxID=47853 RepID=A0A1C5A9X0_9ACTN|nr:hypothetical protein [Micromonospora carbonacea]SCF41926.1 hypothetical protein GA0070563_11216 [Micromonospora carbonacea]